MFAPKDWVVAHKGYDCHYSKKEKIFLGEFYVVKESLIIDGVHYLTLEETGNRHWPVRMFNHLYEDFDKVVMTSGKVATYKIVRDKI